MANETYAPPVVVRKKSDTPIDSSLKVTHSNSIVVQTSGPAIHTRPPDPIIKSVNQVQPKRMIKKG